ncbi:MAG: 23S rRNA (uracil(1939)-C(5))-methyltransferase RlmD [Bacteroides sp.]|nr:23S rRNA (uracil(1939)-C(5))-methyltransferase RlmD [Bacteroides sp.]MCM1085885.1 23S rRNA (uracil(1939)-C(5))-methyltransferase RlmD [Bacteroides sp.]
MARRHKNGPNRIIENVRIEKAAAEGNSLAHIDGKVLFVNYTAPGDLADVEVIRTKSGYMQGRVLALKEASPLRCEPFCSHFGLCGGCKWQHLQYQEQLRQKQAQVRDHLERIGKIELPQGLPIIGVEDVGQNPSYRNKLEFTFSTKRWLTDSEVSQGQELDQHGREGLGFHLAGKFDKVLDLQRCFLQPEPSNQIRLFVKRTAQELGLDFYDIRNKSGYMRNIMLRNTLDGDFMAVVIIGGEPDAAFNTLMQRLQAEFPGIKSLMYAVNTKVNDSMADLDIELFSGEPWLTMTMPAYRTGAPDLKFRVGPKSFYQTNTRQAARLYRLAADFADIQLGQTVYDLYTGTGTIANYVAGMAAKVIGIEYVEDAVRDARVNSQLNGISNTGFFAGDMAKVFSRQFVEEHGIPDVIITDPPREGMHENVTDCLLDDSLFGRNPVRLVYVSCNSATQARDLQRLSSKYRVLNHQAVDMFPFTDHVESVVLLERAAF